LDANAMQTYIGHMNTAAVGDRGVLSWAQWQYAVLMQLRADFAEVLQLIGMDEVDWDSWRNFYNEGRTPKSAVDRALERDF
jgi:hypothetical protein